MPVDQNSLGPLSPNVLSVESVSETVYSVQGHGFVTGFKVIVQDGTGQEMEGVTVSAPTGNTFTLTLPFSTPGPYTLVVVNPDGYTSTMPFVTPGTSTSNSVLRMNS
jgi:hypothetical protein